MDLKDYYKRHIYDYGYNDGYDKKANAVGSVYFEDEADYYIVADWIGLYLGDVDDISDNDKKFIEALGFTLDDFKED